MASKAGKLLSKIDDKNEAINKTLVRNMVHNFVSSRLDNWDREDLTIFVNDTIPHKTVKEMSKQDVEQLENAVWKEVEKTISKLKRSIPG